MRKIEELLINKYDNHIMPFLWMHGEDELTIRNYMKQIDESGIKSVCIESRPHEEFLKEKWWQDVDVIIKECEERNMTLWILDDKHFPTGYAAGEIVKNHQSLQKEFLNFQQFDFAGPKRNAGIMLEWATASERPNIMSVGVEQSSDYKLNANKSQIISVIAARKKDFNSIYEEEMLDLTECVKGDTLYWDIPSGEWSIFIFFTTTEGGEASTEGYLNPLIPEATDILINTVYKSHYDHYQDKFGTTIKGFFSDEPRFGNIKGPDASIGRMDMPLPWRGDLLDLLADRMGTNKTEILKLLPLLYRGDSNKAHEIRYQFMELITDLYRDNFTNRIGDWCKQHGVEYIGHVIEDNNAHSRLGYGAGHFFKSMAGQDMSGIDVVLHQLLPQHNQGYFKGMTATGWDGEFFHYALAKMGASLGSLDSRKKGRTMCEVYGAYGWSEGIKLMKWIADHMLVRGVNYFVPHAFSMKAYPDADCPPHLYAHGHNPQFPYLRYLMDYTNRISHLLSDGTHKADVAVLYHAEAEWSGEYMPIQKVTRILTEKQVEFDVVSGEMIQNADVEEKTFKINKQAFNTLIIPAAERLPEKMIAAIERFVSNGIRVVFVDHLLEGSSEGNGVSSGLTNIARYAKVVGLDELLGEILSGKVDRLVTNKALPYLRYYHYQQNEQSIFMLFNENTAEDISFEAHFPTLKKLTKYDPFDNQIVDIIRSREGYPVTLSKGESLILFESSDTPTEFSLENISNHVEHSLNKKDWKLTFDGVGLVGGSREKYVKELPLLGLGDEYNYFSGKITYETILDQSVEDAYLMIEDASEVVSVFINDQLVGTKISNPYKFDLSGKLDREQNKLKIEVINNLGRNKRDYLSQYLTLDPLGINGSVIVQK